MNTIYFQRHGLRLDIVDKFTGNNNWQSSQRCTEHFNDSPLFDNNEPAIYNNISLIDEQLDAIYTSPATRCIETSLIYAKILNVPIIVEYGLMESYTYNTHHLNSNYIFNEMNEPVSIKNKLYTSNIDKNMLPSRLIERYPLITINSQYQPEDIPISISMDEWSKRYVNILNYIRLKHENVLIVAHSNHILHGVQYIANKTMNSLYKYVEGDARTGTLAICKKDELSIPVYQNGQLLVLF